MNPDVESRLAALAPTIPPDPQALATARARVDAVVGGSDGTAPVDAVHAVFSPDVVVPLARRPRHRRRAVVGAAAAAVVVGVTVVVPSQVVPRVIGTGTLAMAESCAEEFPDATTLDVRRLDGKAVALLRSGDALVQCDDTGTVSIAPGEEPWLPPAAGQVDVVGHLSSATDGTGAAQSIADLGLAGEGVTSMEVTTTTGRVVDAAVGHGYWVALYLGDPDEMAAKLSWTLDDGTVHRATAAELEDE